MARNIAGVLYSRGATLGTCPRNGNVGLRANRGSHPPGRCSAWLEPGCEERRVLTALSDPARSVPFGDGRWFLRKFGVEEILRGRSRVLPGHGMERALRGLPRKVIMSSSAHRTPPSDPPQADADIVDERSSVRPRVEPEQPRKKLESGEWSAESSACSAVVGSSNSCAWGRCCSRTCRQITHVRGCSAPPSLGAIRSCSRVSSPVGTPSRRRAPCGRACSRRATTIEARSRLRCDVPVTLPSPGSGNFTSLFLARPLLCAGGRARRAWSKGT